MQKKILVVDDAELNRELLLDILGEDYIVDMADDGEQALKKLDAGKNEISALLLDLLMPKMDGYSVLEEMNKSGLINLIPVLIISGEESITAENRCFDLGVSDFIHKPFEPSIVQNRVKNAVELFAYKNQLEEKVEKQTVALRKQYKLLQVQAAKLKASNERIIEVLGTVVENRNLESGEHVKRVKGFTKILAKYMMEYYPEYGLDDRKIEIIVNASSLHDIGKIAIPDKILLKPGRLTNDEYEYMKSHTTRGCDILKDIKGIWDEEYQKVSIEICRHHHERYDGKGYPDGLTGDDIPISAQIVSVADVYDALVHERVYKDAFSKEEAFHMIINGECGVFSPKLMECFRKAKSEFEELADV